MRAPISISVRAIYSNSENILDIFPQFSHAALSRDSFVIFPANHGAKFMSVCGVA